MTCTPDIELTASERQLLARIVFTRGDRDAVHASLRSTDFKETWMKSLIVGDKQTVERLVERLKQAGSHREYQRIQCVPIRATLGSSAGEIAQLLGWSTATVHVLHSRWAKVGDVIFDLRPPGGRRHQHLSVEQERERLAPFAERAHAGGMLTVTEIQQAYQRQVGQEVAPSTINRLLERHGESARVIAGGTDSLTRFTLNGFNTLMILDEQFCQPFDENRRGLNLGEGAEDTRRRARYAELSGGPPGACGRR
jgi:transposase